MALRLGEYAPNFTADTTQGPIEFYDWKGGGWAVLFSIPGTSRRCAPPSLDTRPN